MRLFPLYRVHKENHNDMFFFTRTQAEEFAHAKDAEVDTFYFYDHEKALVKVEQNGVW